MELEILQLTAGTPMDCESSEGRDPEHYELTPVTPDGAQKQALLAEAACWELVTTSEEIYDHEEQGRYVTPIGEDATPLLESGCAFVVWNGQLVGVRYEGTLYFLPQGFCVGSRHRYVTVKEGVRSEEYERHTTSVRKTAPSAQAVYYAPEEGDAYATVYGVDPFAERAVIENAKTILYGALRGCKRLCSLALPATLTQIKNISTLSLEGCESLTELTVDPANPVFHAQGNCLIRTADKCLVAGALRSEIPADGSVTKIGEFVFYRAAIRHVTIPDGVTEIGQYAFSQSRLDSVVLPKTLVRVGRGAFGYCHSMQVYFTGTKQEWSKELQLAFGTKNIRYYSEQPPTDEGLFWHYGTSGEIEKW